MAATDRGVTMMRKLLLKAIEDVRAGKDPLFVNRDPHHDPFADMAVIGKEVPAGTDVRTFWRKLPV